MADLVGYYTENNISHSVMRQIKNAGIEIAHIEKFNKDKTPIFYGILRGTGSWMLWCQRQGKDFYYIDNGYYDAIYMDLQKVKDMSGKYRVVKNGMIEPYIGRPEQTPLKTGMKVLMLPPSPYSAFMHDTTPEDWNQEWVNKFKRQGWEVTIRDKSEQKPLNKHMADFDIVMAFNSMGIMTAISGGKYVFDTHGILRNADRYNNLLERYEINHVKQFYEPKNLTLGQISEGKWV